MFCSFMGGVSFGGRVQRPRFGLWSPEGYTAFSSFTHFLRLPPAPAGDVLLVIQVLTKATQAQWNNMDLA
jgi:hypothetical protein